MSVRDRCELHRQGTDGGGECADAGNPVAVFAPPADQGHITEVRKVRHVFRELRRRARSKVNTHFAGIFSGADGRVGEGCFPGGEIMRSEYDLSEEVTTTRWHESPRSCRTKTKRDVIVREVIDDLVEEFLREVWGIDNVDGCCRSESMRPG